MNYREVLNDLIEINNDRIEGYEKAAKQTDETDLKALFTEMAGQSRKLVSDLKAKVAAAGEEPAEGTTVRGKVYRTWMDLKAVFGGDDRKGILSSCEYGEDAAQKAYKEALSDDDLPADIRSIVAEQKSALRQSHDKIKALRDAQPA